MSHFRFSCGALVTALLAAAACSDTAGTPGGGAGAPTTAGGAGASGLAGAGGMNNGGMSNGGMSAGGMVNAAGASGGGPLAGAAGAPVAGMGGMGGAPMGGGAGGMGEGGVGGSAGAATGGSGVGGGGAGVFALTSPSLTQDGMFDAENTCDGGDTSPELTWTAGPEGTLSYAITLYDETGNFPHWAIWNLPAMPRMLAADIGTTPPEGTMQVSFAQDDAYRGPCPGGPDPGNSHTYVFTVYALTTATFTPPSMDPAAVRNALNDLDVPTATLSGSSLAGN